MERTVLDYPAAFEVNAEYRPECDTRLGFKELTREELSAEWPIMFTKPSDAEVNCILTLDFAIGTDSGSQLTIARALVVR